MKNSKRSYALLISWGGTTSEFLQPSLHEIIHGDAEVYYALQEQLDKVLDLHLADSMYFQPNRDDENSKGIIVRVR